MSTLESKKGDNWVTFPERIAVTTASILSKLRYEMRMRANPARTHPVKLFMGMVFSLRELKICQTEREPGKMA
jgi:hypothetical protein